MDRCRCDDYAAAIKQLRFYTVGTHRPDIIDNYDRTGYVVAWKKHGVDYEDMKFLKPKATKDWKPHELETLSKGSQKIEQMWCPYMTPVKG